jgi:hypothetical protein
VLSWSWCGSLVTSAAHPREQDADVQAPMHFLHVRLRHRLQAIWAGNGRRGLCAWRIPLHNCPRGDRPLQLGRWKQQELRCFMMSRMTGTSAISSGRRSELVRGPATKHDADRPWTSTWVLFASKMVGPGTWSSPHLRPPIRLVIALPRVVFDGPFHCIHAVVQQHWCQAHVMATKPPAWPQLVLLLQHRLHGRSAHHVTRGRRQPNGVHCCPRCILGRHLRCRCCSLPF